jgi:hypothetical protein
MDKPTLNPSLPEALKGNFVVVNLGCVGDWDYDLPPDLQKAMSVVEVDAAAPAQTSQAYHQKFSVDRVISGTPGKQTFRINTFIGSSSLLPPKLDLIRAYGAERYYQPKSETEVDCETLPNLLQRFKLPTVAFLKTDLEGMDFAVVKSCEATLPQIPCVQCELRLEPLYDGEPHFHEVVAYLVAQGFELVGLRTEYWKYHTEHRVWQVHGRPVWADCIFFLRPDAIAKLAPEQQSLLIAKQIIIATMLGKKNLAEFRLQQSRTQLPATWLPLLESLVKPRLPRVQGALGALRRFFWPFELTLRHLIGSSRHVATK